MVQAKDNFKRTTISLRSEEYEALRFVAFKNKTSVAGVVRRIDIRTPGRRGRHKGRNEGSRRKREHDGLGYL